MIHLCCDPDCRREFESDLPPRTVLNDPICPECAEAFDQLLADLRGKGVTVEFIPAIREGTTGARTTTTWPRHREQIMIANLNEAREEARRLMKIHGRDVEIKSVECCEFDRTCACGGQGYFYQLVFSCGHDAEVDPQNECEENSCAWREYKSFCVRTEEQETAEVA